MPQIGRVRYLEALPPVGPRPRGVLLLLHAFPLNARMWEPQMTVAETGWRVIAPHFRGFDQGVSDPAATSVEDYAGDLIDLIDALHLQDVVVGGLSMGGYVAFALLRHAASYVRALVLADTRAPGDTPEGRQGRERMLQTLADRGVAAIGDEMVPKLLGRGTLASRPDVVAHVHELIMTSPPNAVAGAIRALMTRPDSTPLLSTIHVPTLVIVGEEDTLTPPSQSDILHRAISGSELVRIPGAGHLSNLEQPDAFTAALARFLTSRV